VYRRTSEMAREEEETGQNDAIIDFLQTHEKAKAVDIAERLYSTIHMSVGEVQLYLGKLIDKNQVVIDKHGYHSWTIASSPQ
jgi:predicted transcriptional regulator